LTIESRIKEEHKQLERPIHTGQDKKRRELNRKAASGNREHKRREAQHKKETIAAAIKISKGSAKKGETAEGRLRRVWFDPSVRTTGETPLGVS